jgi:tRNA-specific 2-thiouridylase
VFRHFLDEYAAGRTPNPDVLCNSEIKFKAFLEYALRLGADYIATGHYARVVHADGHAHLYKALDGDKDQSYFLHAVPEAALARSLFPLGGLLKSEVRKLARAAGFANHAKKDSTGICFIGERRFADFLCKYLPTQPGDIETPEGGKIGTHDGLMYYTLGQRQGIGVGGRRDAEASPWYVAGKDLRRNVLLAVQGHNHPRLMQTGLTAVKLHWISGIAPTVPLHCSAKIRYRQIDQPCTLTRIQADSCAVEFEQPQRAVAPGQYAVFYAGDECLGGGVIATTHAAGADIGDPARLREVG